MSDFLGMTSQTTRWNYGVSTSTGSAIDWNDVVGDVEYPNHYQPAAKAWPWSPSW
jgi:hypothetical protein